MHLCVWQSLQIGFSALPGKENIVLSPEDDGLGLLLFEECLPRWVEADIGAVVVKEIQLDLTAVWLLQSREEVRVPIVRADQLGQFRPMQIDSFHRVIGEQASNTLFVLRCPVVPQ